MIFRNETLKRDENLQTRIPKVLKDAFCKLAQKKGKSRSDYLIALILKELEAEGIEVQALIKAAKR